MSCPAASAGRRTATPAPVDRCLVLGLDGGTFDLLDPLLEAGEMPFLASLARRGRSAPLRSVYPPKTIPAWYSFATGLDPGGLGIFGFTEPDGGPGRSRIVQTFRPAEAVWDALSRRGRSVGVLNFPLQAGYPLHGFLLPGMISERPSSYPIALRPELESALGERCVPELPAYREAARGWWVEEATRGVAQRARAAEWLLDRYRPDFLFVLFRETDRIEHQHWAELARGPLAMPRDLRAFWRSVDEACRTIDRAFRERGGKNATLVISDHGHGAAEADFFTNRWLQREGFLTLKNGGESRRRRVASRLLMAFDRAGPTRRIVRSAIDRVRSADGGPGLGGLVAGEASFEAMARRIDWEKTLAFSYPVPEGIYLNRYHPDFTAARGEQVVAEIRRRLEAFPDARIEVFEPKELYRGHNLARAPALLFRVDGLATELRMDFSYPEPFLASRPGYFYGSGVHRMDGILLADGGLPLDGARGEALSLLDVAPTILEGMGLPVPANLPGRSFGARLGWSGA